MLKRVITGAVLFAIILPVLYFSDTWALPILMSLCAGLAVFEMLRCLGVVKNLGISIPAILCGLASPLLARYVGQELYFEYAVCAFLVIAVYLFGLAVFSHGKLTVDSVGLTFMTTLYISLGFGGIVLLRDLPGVGKFVFLIVFLVSWLTDIFAYLTGYLFGKHKLIPDVSPKKTIEGSIGGIVFCIGGLLLYGWIASLVWEDAFPDYLVLAAAGLILSLVSQVGDLIMSLIKRRFNIKDYGKIFPGHGGMLDRFDSILAVTVVLLPIALYTPLFT